MGMNTTATAWLAVDSGAFAVGLVLAARMLPNLLFGLAAGALADRAGRRRVIVSVSLLNVLVALGLSWLASAGHVAAWQLVAVTFTSGWLNVADMPSRQALVMESVPPRAASNAMAAHALVGRVCTAVGALLAGALIPSVSVSACYWAIAFACAVSALLATRIVPMLHPTTHQQPTERTSFAQAIGDAARLVVTVPAVRTLVTASIVCEVFGFAFMTAVPVFARDVLLTGADGLGTLNAATSLGGSLAVATLSLVPSRVPREPLLGGVFLVYGGAMVALSASQSLQQAAAALLVIGACAALFDVLQQTLMQLAVPDHLRGRAVGVWAFGIGSGPLGHLEMGALASQYGAPLGLALNGGLVMVGAGVLLVRAPRFRSLRVRPS
jgi:MFS family permease